MTFTDFVCELAERQANANRSPPPLTPSRDANRVWQHCAPTVDRGDSNRNTEGRRLDDLVVAQIDRDVVDIAAVPVPEDQVTGLRLADGHARSLGVLRLRPVCQIDAL